MRKMRETKVRCMNKNRIKSIYGIAIIKGRVLDLMIDPSTRKSFLIYVSRDADGKDTHDNGV